MLGKKSKLFFPQPYKILKPGGRFRCILPDMEIYALDYINAISQPSLISENEVNTASIRLLKKTLLGMEHKVKGFNGLATLLFGNSGHRWMWDKHSLAKALADQGFVDIEPFLQNTCDDKMFLLPEDDENFHNAFCLQCRKPLINESKKCQSNNGI